MKLNNEINKLIYKKIKKNRCFSENRVTITQADTPVTPFDVGTCAQDFTNTRETRDSGLLRMLIRPLKERWPRISIYRSSTRWNQFTVHLGPSCTLQNCYYAMCCGLLGYRPSGCRDIAKHHHYYQLIFHTAVFIKMSAALGLRRRGGDPPVSRRHR